MAGTLIVIGGHEDREGEKAILKEVAERAGRRKVVLVASQEPGELIEAYRKAFAELGVKDVVVERSRFRVIGRGGVTVVDAGGVTFSSVADAEPDKPISVHDAKLHALAHGDRFDLKPRRPFLPRAAEV